MRKRTILITIDDDAVRLMDLIAITEWTSRSAIIRKAVEDWVNNNNRTIKNTILESNNLLNDADSGNKWSEDTEEDNDMWFESVGLKWNTQSTEQNVSSEELSDRICREDASFSTSEIQLPYTDWWDWDNFWEGYVQSMENTSIDKWDREDTEWGWEDTDESWSFIHVPLW